MRQCGLHPQKAVPLHRTPRIVKVGPHRKWLANRQQRHQQLGADFLSNHRLHQINQLGLQEETQ